MDSLTHIAVGALMGEVIAGKALGKRAMLLGAVTQSLPDIDVLAALLLPTTDNLLAHRGITHSIFAGIFTTIILAWAAQRTHKTYALSLLQWILFFAAEIFTHLFLDAFNNYGVGWFEPFNHTRISFNTLFVIDPLFTVWPVIACTIILFLPNKHSSRKWIVWPALFLSGCYLILALVNKYNIDHTLRRNLEQQHISYNRYFTAPTDFNTFLWYTVVQDSSGFLIGYHSVMDATSEINFSHVKQMPSLLDSLKERHDVELLQRFSKGFYTVEAKHDTVIFNDLRFGQIGGWKNPDAPFVFHFYVNYSKANLLVLQRGRVADVNWESFEKLVARIRGQ